MDTMPSTPRYPRSRRSQIGCIEVPEVRFFAGRSGPDRPVRPVAECAVVQLWTRCPAHRDILVRGAVRSDALKSLKFVFSLAGLVPTALSARSLSVPWSSYGHDAQHTAISSFAAQSDRMH